MLLTLLWACVDTPRECEGYGSPEAVGTLENDELVEASGLAVSPEQAVVWSHNDKGDGARIFGVGLDGSDLGVWTLPGQILDDAEDIAFDAEGRLVLGDIGDNNRSRDSVRLLRFAEPDVSTAGGAIGAIEEFELTYPGKIRDAESLAVDPSTGNIYVFEKANSGRVSVYRADLSSGAFVEETKIHVPGDGDMAVTAADFTPDGERLLLRTRDRVLVWTRGDNLSISSILENSACEAPVADEEQGEALGAASWGFLTVSEGEAPQVFRSDRQ